MIYNRKSTRDKSKKIINTLQSFENLKEIIPCLYKQKILFKWKTTYNGKYYFKITS